MGQRDVLLEHTRAQPGRCDDCVADELGIQARQTVRALATDLQDVGLLVRERAACIRCGRTKTVSRVGDPGAAPLTSGRARRGHILDGVAALDEVLRRAGYASVVHAVAQHTVFLHPETVAQTHGLPVFPVIRARLNAPRRTIVERPDGRRLWADDNGPPTWAFLWAAGRGKGADVQFNHVWPGSDLPERYTALWNLCATPAFLAKTTDSHPEVQAALRFRAHALYGFQPDDVAAPAEPPGYASLRWAEPPAPVADLERAYRDAMRACPKNSATVAARTLGWLFSDWRPDGAL